MKNALKAGMGPFTLGVLSLLLVMSTVSRAQESDSTLSLRANLISFNQVPSVLTKSKGLFEAQVAQDGAISFSLSYANMSSPVVQAHIHFGASNILDLGGRSPSGRSFFFDSAFLGWKRHCLQLVDM